MQGVTYCGDTNKGPNRLTMDNVPWLQEVCEFTEQLAELLPDYALACEHAHSNCILMANKTKVGFYASQ